MKKPTIYIDGKYSKVDHKVIDGMTPGIFKAEGVFETMLGIGGKVFDVKDHLDRLHRSFKGIKISPRVIQKVVEVNGFDICRVRVVAWKEAGVSHVAVMAIKYQRPTKDVFNVALIKTTRPANSRLANVKSLDYKLFADAYHKAKAQGYDEAVLINAKGHVFEASRANIFIVKNGQFWTPPLSSGCLNGITRKATIQQAKRLGITVIEKNLTVADIRFASVCFLTNSLLGIKLFRLV